MWYRDLSVWRARVLDAQMWGLALLAGCVVVESFAFSCSCTSRSPCHEIRTNLLFPLSCNRQRRIDSCWLLCFRGQLLAQGHLSSYQCTLLPTFYSRDLNRWRSGSQAKIQTTKNENAKEWVTFKCRHWFHRTVEQCEDCLDSNWCRLLLSGQLFERHVWSRSASLRMWISPNPTYFSLLRVQ